MKKYFLLGVVLLLSACASLEIVSKSLNSKWVGRDYDEFVMVNGIAKTNQKLQDGTTMYLWEESNCKLNILVDSDNVIQNVQARGVPRACNKVSKRILRASHFL